MEAEAEAVIFLVGLLEAEAEAVKKSTASASLVYGPLKPPPRVETTSGIRHNVFHGNLFEHE